MQPTIGAGVDPPRRRNPWLIPLVLSSVTLAVLVVAIVVVLSVRGAPGSTRTATGTAPADACPVGTWAVTSYAEKVAVNGVGDVEFSGSGAEVRFRADGTGVTDYKDGTVFTAKIKGISYRLVVTGHITYSYRAEAGRVTFSDVRANGKETVTREDTGESVTDDLVGTMDPARYACTDDVLTESTDRYTARMARVSRNA